jgi:hypothetical protein
MRYLPAKVTNVTNEVCANGCFGRNSVLELRGPGQFGLPKESWDSMPRGYSAYHCSLGGFLWFKRPRRVTGTIPVGFWNSSTKAFTAYSPA